MRTATGLGDAPSDRERSAVVGAGALAHAANSEVLPAGSVAVAVTTLPAGSAKALLKLALPLASVVALTAPRKVWPSPKPEGSQLGLEKNSILNVVLAWLFRVPCTVLVPSALVTVSTGKFCR